MSDTVKSYTPRASEITRQWHVIDATGQPLGRLAGQAAVLLRGKHKPTFAPHMDVGDFVIIVNASQVGITGKNKPLQKMYYRHSGYPGGFRQTSLQTMMARHPERVIEHAIKGMLPKNSLGGQMFRKLRVYAGATHPRTGQVAASEGVQA